MPNIIRVSSSSADLTGNAQTNDVLSGKTFYNTDEDTKLTGTLRLTGNAQPSDVISGKTFYNTDAKAVRAGTLVTTPLSDIFKAIYPVGSIYMSVNSTSPQTLFGGTWVQLKDRFLIGCGKYSNGATGGSETHTLSINEMPAHNHWQTNVSADHNVNAHVNNYKSGNSTGCTWLNQYYDGWVSSKQSVNTLNTGGSQAHNNMPPYLAVYMWKRTA